MCHLTLAATPAGLSASQASGPSALARSATAPPAAALADCNGDFSRTLHAAPAAVPALSARALWLDDLRLRWPDAQAAQAGPGTRVRLLRSARGQVQAQAGQAARGFDSAIELEVFTGALAAETAARSQWFGDGPVFAVPAADRASLPAAHREQLVLVQEDAQGRVLRASAVQAAGALDALYAAAEALPDLGATPGAGKTAFRLWAPTAQAVAVCLHARGSATASRVQPLQRDARTGAWSAQLAGNLSGSSYTYLVDVFAGGVGVVRNRVTDPYSISLTTDSRRSWIGRLDDPKLKPPGWDTTPRPQRVQAAPDMAIYELHVRDFSIGDASVRAPWRGKYLAFTEAASNGMRHLQALSKAGITDVHLLPVFDLASVPEAGCTSPAAGPWQQAGPASELQQAAVMAGAAGDCFNWGYDPWHYTAPEGSFATDAEDGAVRIREFRAMVQALHRAGLRVGMDVVYNHTTAAGQKPQSVLDRIVPGYYQRLNASGEVERSTCCDNTATENRMMAKLMIDSAVVWARDHRIDSFRFDLMGHQPRAAMERLQRAVNAAAGRRVELIGEGWNFGEVQDGRRFVQASQLSLNGSGIGSFSDRTRDAVRGGGAGDSGAALLQRQGWINGLHYDTNPAARAAAASAATTAEQDTRSALLRSADLVRVGLAGTLRGYKLKTWRDEVLALERIDYAGQPAGYAGQPSEVVNYVENHDNQTLFDNNVFKLPPGTRSEDRARVQLLGLAVTAFSQGVAYFHAGVEALRSKSLDRNSYDSGDWFNRLDWTFSDNHFGTGLPPKADNGDSWALMAPLLADTSIKPTAADIRFTRDAFLDLLRIRASSSLFRLRTAEEVNARLHFHNTGANQEPTVALARLDGRGLAGAGFDELLYAINVDTRAHTLRLPELAGRAYALHPVHLARGAADARPAQLSRWTAASGQLLVPPRTALVFVLPVAR
jgi:pullulanase/glycogen debranching enzyme